MKTLEEIEKEVLVERLKVFDWNKAKVAKSLGITIKTVYNKMSRWKIPYKKEEHIEQKRYDRPRTYGGHALPSQHILPQGRKRTSE